jgi:hypothetical protein
MKHAFVILAAFALCLAAPVSALANTIRVLVWDEQQPQQKQAYGDKFLGETIAAYLSAQPGMTVKTATLDSPEQGVDEATLDSTDVLIWWGHVRNKDLTDAMPPASWNGCERAGWLSSRCTPRIGQDPSFA